MRRRASPFNQSTVLDGVKGSLAHSAAEPPLTPPARRAGRAHPCDGRRADGRHPKCSRGTPGTHWVRGTVHLSRQHGCRSLAFTTANVAITWSELTFEIVVAPVSAQVLRKLPDHEGLIADAEIRYSDKFPVNRLADFPGAGVLALCCERRGASRDMLVGLLLVVGRTPCAGTVAGRVRGCGLPSLALLSA